MSFSPPTLPPFPAQTSRRVVSQPVWTARRVSRPAPVYTQSRVTRRFETECLVDGDIHQEMRVAPALPIFEQAFGAFTHGAGSFAT